MDGRYLAVGGLNLRVYDSTDFAPIVEFSDFPGLVHCVGFGEGVVSIAAGSVDHNLRIFGHD